MLLKAKWEVSSSNDTEQTMVVNLTLSCLLKFYRDIFQKVFVLSQAYRWIKILIKVFHAFLNSLTIEMVVTVGMCMKL